MTKNKYALVLFDSPHHAAAFDKLAKEKSVPGRLIPVPRAISDSCGMCFRCPAGERESLTRLFDGGVTYKAYIESYEI